MNEASLLQYKEYLRAFDAIYTTGWQFDFWKNFEEQ